LPYLKISENSTYTQLRVAKKRNFMMPASITINHTLRDFDHLPDSAQVRLPTVKALLGVSSATCWRLVKAGKLRTYKLTERTTTFSVCELRAFLASKAEG
jgi:predicted DNA-binding transcriptional regulator AlpA